MNKVYMVEGWFGDQEWNERCFDDVKNAQTYCDHLRVDRTSARWANDYYLQGLCKFTVEEYEVY